MADLTSHLNAAPGLEQDPLKDRLHLAIRAWLLWLQGLFKSRPPGAHRWSASLADTEIVITDQEPDIEPTSKRPIIYTQRGPASWMSLSFSQLMETSIDSENRTFSDLLACSVNLNVIAREGLEAQSIAYLVFRMIPLFRATICRAGRLHAIGNRMSIGTESPAGQVIPGSSVPEWKVVSIGVPFFIQETTRITSSEFHNMVRAVNLHVGLDS